MNEPSDVTLCPAGEAALGRIAQRLTVDPCGDERFGVFLHGSAESYIGLAGPGDEDEMKRWRWSVLMELQKALQP